jgi:hypothetical protein
MINELFIIQNKFQADYQNKYVKIQKDPYLSRHVAIIDWLQGKYIVERFECELQFNEEHLG